jgi:POT family proton-dependent oligopeptide transporter
LQTRFSGFKNHPFGASVMILGNLIIAFSPLHFFIWELHLQLLEQVSSSQIFLQWLGSFIKGGTVRDAGFGLFYSELSIVRGAVCVYLEQVQTTVGCYALSAAIVMVIGLLIFLITKHSLGSIGDSPLLDQTSSKRTKRLLFMLALISIPLIFIMIKNTDYTDYFMYAIGPLAILYFLLRNF